MKIHKPVRVPITPFPDSSYTLSGDDLRAYLTLSGSLLYGPTSWQSPLARDLRITPRSLRRYLDGTRPIPISLLLTLSRLTFERADSLISLSHDLSHEWDKVTSSPVDAAPSKVLVPVTPKRQGDLSPLTWRRKQRAGKA